MYEVLWYKLSGKRIVGHGEAPALVLHAWRAAAIRSRQADNLGSVASNPSSPRYVTRTQTCELPPSRPSHRRPLQILCLGATSFNPAILQYCAKVCLVLPGTCQMELPVFSPPSPIVGSTLTYNI